LLTSNAQLWVVAMGMTFVMIAGAVDLSVGAIMAFLAIMFGMLLKAGVSGGLALPITIAAGALLGGGVNGVLIGRLGLSFLLVTLASLTAFTGLVNLWSDTMAIPVQASITDSIAFGNFLGVNISLWIMGVTFILAQLLQSRTYFGRDVYAVGGNRQAARLAGINTERTIVFVFALTGIASALAAVIGIGRNAHQWRVGWSRRDRTRSPLPCDARERTEPLGYLQLLAADRHRRDPGERSAAQPPRRRTVNSVAPSRRSQLHPDQHV
jgi:ribose transport system permease protein